MDMSQGIILFVIDYGTISRETKNNKYYTSWQPIKQ
jgi:hypothetical protein